MANADAVITATASPHPVIYAEDMAPILEQRHGMPLVMVDIAVPRDVDLCVGSLPGVVLHDIDQLEATLDRNLSRRLAAIPEVEEIVASETHVVLDWLHGREASNLVVELREHAKSVAEAELSAALRKLDGIDKGTEEVISRMANRIVGKLLHQPSEQLKSRAASEDFQTYCDAIVDLFGLKHPAKPERLPQPDVAAGKGEAG
jgi:glutamyl-tRNA reductase